MLALIAGLDGQLDRNLFPQAIRKVFDRGADQVSN